MDSLCIRDALELHHIVSPYLPDVVDDNPLEVIHQTIRNMKDNNPRAYLDSILLMSKKTVEELMAMNSDDILSLFIDGLVANQIASLDVFCNRLGVKHG